MTSNILLTFSKCNYLFLKFHKLNNEQDLKPLKNQRLSYKQVSEKIKTPKLNIGDSTFHHQSEHLKYVVRFLQNRQLDSGESRPLHHKYHQQTHSSVQHIESQ